MTNIYYKYIKYYYNIFYNFYIEIYIIYRFVNDTKGITYLAKWLSDEKKEESIVLPVLLKTLKRLPITLNVLKITKLGVVLKGFTNSNNKGNNI